MHISYKIKSIRFYFFFYSGHDVNTTTLIQIWTIIYMSSPSYQTGLQTGAVIFSWREALAFTVSTASILSIVFTCSLQHEYYQGGMWLRCVEESVVSVSGAHLVQQGKQGRVQLHVPHPHRNRMFCVLLSDVCLDQPGPSHSLLELDRLEFLKWSRHFQLAALLKRSSTNTGFLRHSRFPANTFTAATR